MPLKQHNLPVQMTPPLVYEISHLTRTFLLDVCPFYRKKISFTTTTIIQAVFNWPQCQKKCQKNSGCIAYTWMSSVKSCLLYDSTNSEWAANLVLDSTAVSGSVSCGGKKISNTQFRGDRRHFVSGETFTS